MNPTKGQKAAYTAVLDIQQDVIDRLTVGTKVCDAGLRFGVAVWRCVIDACFCYAHVVSLSQISTAIKAVVERARGNRSKLGDAFVDNLCKTFGSGVGMVPSEDSLVLSAENDAVIQYVPRASKGVCVCGGGGGG